VDQISLAEVRSPDVFFEKDKMQMPMNSKSRTSLHTAVGFLLAMANAWAQPQTATVDAINKAVNAAVSNPADRAYTICQLSAALWGNYTVQVTVPQASTTGKQALIFQVAGGILTQQVSSIPSNPIDFATAWTTGTVFLPDRDAAFAKGVPFWIGDVSFPGPDPLTVRYTVYSNPSLTAPGAQVPSGVSDQFETIVPSSLNPQGFDLDAHVIYNRFTASSQPQTFAGSIFADPTTSSNVLVLNPGYEYYLWAGFGSPLSCPVSNQVDLAAATVNTPSIRRQLPVLQVWDYAGKISSGSWIAIFGEKFSSTTRSWRDSDFQGALAPTSLDGVRVNINGKPGFISYISPNQINAQVPDDDTLGPVTVEVVNAVGTSNPVSVTKALASPALLTTPDFLVNGKQYVAALFPDNTTFVGPQSFIPGVTSRPAKPGDTIIVYAVGCGPTAAPSGQVLSQAQPLALPYNFQFGQTAAQAQGFLAAQSVGLCVFNITVPEVPDGDVTITSSVGGAAGAPLFTTILH
jgi:uncharacterized protein (TIGR03437 family)